MQVKKSLRLDKGRKISRIQQSGNREWVSAIECVSASCKIVPVYLIYQGKSYLMGNHNCKQRFDAISGLAKNRWSDRNYRYQSLSTSSEPMTRSDNQHRLPIIKSHS